jgi:uncharacterized membrane-anchored protein
VVDAEPVVEETADEPAPARLPDDPGVAPEEEDTERPGKFRLF